MDEIQFFGEVKDDRSPTKKKRKSKSPRMLLAGEWNERITGWCTVCAMWHGERCPTIYLRERGLPVTEKDTTQNKYKTFPCHEQGGAVE